MEANGEKDKKNLEKHVREEQTGTTEEKTKKGLWRNLNSSQEPACRRYSKVIPPSSETSQELTMNEGYLPLLSGRKRTSAES